ncbi:hypothetical protein B9G55_15620 [Saccharibacillus sp. O16]|nr:hypothetical protein B9G55_15620 [Saccharibacillus sp. O16]
MDVLSAYLDSLFAAWPRTTQVTELKREMLGTMEEKYEELKQSGRSEHEAIGIVISEFGSIDELMDEMGIQPAGEADLTVSEETVRDYEQAVRRASRFQAIGWLCILIGVAATLFIAGLNDDGGFAHWSDGQAYLFAVIILLLFVVPALGLFIAGRNAKGNYDMLNEEFVLAPGTETYVRRQMEGFAPLRSRSMVIAACLGTLSPVALLIAGMQGEAKTPYGASIMLVLLGGAVFLFVYSGGIQAGYQRLLQLGEYTPEKKEANRVIARIAAIAWPLAFAVFFISGFLYQRWDVNWVVFPLTGVLFAAIGGLYGMQHRARRKV